MRASLSLLAFASAASAISLVKWVGHNGLVSEYQAIMREHKNLYSTFEAADAITVFIPTNNAIHQWRSMNSTQSMSWTAVDDNFEYMAVRGSYTTDDLDSPTSQQLTTFLSGESVRSLTLGVAPGLTNTIQSGAGRTATNSTITLGNFKIDNGHVQLVDTVFALPEPVLTQANKNPAKNAGARSTVSFWLSASAVTACIAALL